jgi:hypothetical protein
MTQAESGVPSTIGAFPSGPIQSFPKGQGYTYVLYGKGFGGSDEYVQKTLYYEETLKLQITDGDGSVPDSNMFAKFPHTPTESAPSTPGAPRRRIRCKMCR